MNWAERKSSSQEIFFLTALMFGLIFTASAFLLQTSSFRSWKRTLQGWWISFRLCHMKKYWANLRQSKIWLKLINCLSLRRSYFHSSSPKLMRWIPLKKKQSRNRCFQARSHVDDKLFISILKVERTVKWISLQFYDPCIYVHHKFQLMIYKSPFISI